MGKKKQVYVVVHGRQPGIYNQWYGAEGAAIQVQDFPEAIFRGFYTPEEANEWLRTFSAETLQNLAPGLWESLQNAPPPVESERPEAELEAGKVLIFTDGGALGNPGPGGYGIVLRYRDHRKELSGGYRLTTNNRMEILACIQGLSALKKASQVVLYSDSMYVVESMAKGWAKRWQENNWMRNKKEKAENADLWAQLLDLCDRHKVEFRWTRSHSGTKDNERCDQLATAAARRPGLPADPGYNAMQ